MIFNHLITGCDHAGFILMREIFCFLKERKISFEDLGTKNNEDSVDYPLYAKKVVQRMHQKNDLSCAGLLICGSGIGMSIAANRFQDIRAALCHDVASAVLSRQHNNANVLVLGARIIKASLAKEIVMAFLSTSFEGGRHQKRIEMLSS